MKVLFMGTPEFAAECLSAVLAAGHTVVGVVTQPDKPVGRGGKVKFSAVKDVALAHGLPVFQPKRVRRPEVIERLKELGAEVTVVVAFGQIISQEALEISPLGSINVHGSLLPRWRGAAPIQRAIMSGDEETGITTMWMDAGIDTGDMCLVARTPILPEDNFGTLHDRLAAMGAKLLVETLRQVEEGLAPRIPQPEEGVTYAAKLERADEIIDWDRSAEDIWCQVRALDPWPGAFTVGPKGNLKIWKASLYHERHGRGTPGQVVEIIKKRGFVVATGEGFLLVEEVQPPGKGRMEAHAYVNGGGVQVGTRLTSPEA
ncbi:MAG: 10-Formyltetrahydrofolate:L-methionyl-tRNA N-formyltransferase [Symbiobacteriaceae bacterium]|nr:10-Formyltetrahydrofolate:L-methionyl-tRNA N-formyltransferase [Symbiobacteriaceae bacterium]